jgi:hypothetical protein
MLDRNLKIREIDMPYAEREGQSKLKVVRDGLRFLRVIVEAALLYRPERPLSLMAFICLAVAVGLMLTPTMYYMTNHSVAEWMIYRFIVSHLAGIAACLLFSASYVTARIIGMTLGSAQTGPVTTAVKSFLHAKSFWLVPLLLVIAGGWLVVPSFMQLVETGATYEHWSRFIAMSMCLSAALVLVTTRACDYILDLLEDRLVYLHTRETEKLVAAAAAR